MDAVRPSVHKLRQGLADLTRPRRPEAAPIRLTRQRVYILPTAAGLLYGLTLIAMLLGAINYELALGHALVFLLASLALVGMLQTHRNLLGLEISAGSADPVTAGEIAHFRLTVRNPEERPRPSLEWSHGTLDTQPLLQHLRAQDGEQIQIPVPTDTRGWLQLPPLRVASRYPLGLFVAWSTPWPTSRCLVYPQPRITPLPLGRGDNPSGSSMGRDGQEDFAGLRERQPADSLHHVAWKAAAKQQEDKALLVKLFSGGGRTTLWLDWSDTRATSNDGETRLSILAGWVLQAEAAGLDYGLSLPERQIPPGHGAQQRHRCLEALALHPVAASLP